LNAQVKVNMGSENANEAEMAASSVFLHKVAIKWKNLDEEAKERYKLMARNERERYKVELVMWKREKAASEKESLVTKLPPTIRYMDPYGSSSSQNEPSCSQAQDSPGWIVAADLDICVSSTHFANHLEPGSPSCAFDWPESPVNRYASLELSEGHCQDTARVSMLQFDPREMERTMHTGTDAGDRLVSSRCSSSADPYTQQLGDALPQSSYEREHAAFFLEPLPLNDGAWSTFYKNETDALEPWNRDEHTCSPDTVDRLISMLDKEERDLLLLHCSSLD
jgi:hypothetical protein